LKNSCIFSFCVIGLRYRLKSDIIALSVLPSRIATCLILILKLSPL
jgi:hypothetical protein